MYTLNIASLSTSSYPRLLLLGAEEGTKYMGSDAPRLSSDLRHRHINDMFDCWESQGYAMKSSPIAVAFRGVRINF
jgi:hypothetical protein